MFYIKRHYTTKHWIVRGKKSFLLQNYNIIKHNLGVFTIRAKLKDRNMKTSRLKGTISHGSILGRIASGCNAYRGMGITQRLTPQRDVH